MKVTFTTSANDDATAIIERIKVLFVGARLAKADVQAHDLTLVFDNGLQLVISADDGYGYSAPLDIDIGQILDSPLYPIS